MIFNIGDTVFVARANPVEKQVVCPHCFGKKFLTVILGDGSQVKIDCTGCARGYETPTGSVSYHEFTPYVEQHTITGMDSSQSNGQIEVMYWSGCGGFEGRRCFATEAEALARAQELLSEHQKEEERRLNQAKTNQDRSWAWNATYHRNELKRAQESVRYHTAKLDVCKSKAKEVA